MKKLWKEISYNGVDLNNTLSFKDQKRLVFFNQVLFVGFFATLLQIFATWDFLGSQALIFIASPVSIAIAFILNRKGQFNVSKRIFILSIYVLGLYTTFLLGGSGLYHLGVFTNFTFGLILFDIRRERWEILAGIPFLVTCLLIGELSWFNAPDFSNYPTIQSTRFANLFSLIVVNSILTIFIIRLNHKTEDELTTTVQEKDLLLEQLSLKSDQLTKSKSELEMMVEDRTKEILEQRDVLQQQNEEKELLLKEVHHRVKNNLQVIASLINLQLAKFDDESTSEALKETQIRVLSMSLVHTKMYQTNNFKEITILSYCSQLIENVKELYGADEVNYELNIPKEIKLDMETTIPVGLILNEIVSNYFKHVLASKKGNSFSITVEDNSPSHYQVTYKDNGKGFETAVDLTSSKSLGMTLVDSLVDQVDGEFEFYNDNGAVYQFTIKKSS